MKPFDREPAINKIEYLSTNTKGEWWDGKNWRKWGQTDAGQIQDQLRIFETLKTHEENNCHVDGCFTCPRCRRKHFLPDTFDLLCDGCQDIVEHHPQAHQVHIDGIKAMRVRAKLHWTGAPDKGIVERMETRERLSKV